MGAADLLICAASFQGAIRTCINWTENQQAAKIAPQPMVFPSTLAPKRNLLRN
jgi:hypothetical protein